MRRFTVIVLCLIWSVAPGQERHWYQQDFPVEEFKERRAKIFEAIGSSAIAILQGAPGVDGFRSFRQYNNFYYLCGLETPHAYLLMDGRNKRTTLYLPHRDEGRERGEGKMLSAEDAELVRQLTGVDAVAPIEKLARDQVGTLVRIPAPLLYTPFSPPEGEAQSRDELLVHRAGVASDPWDGRVSRESHFLGLLRSRFPSFEIRDLSPIMDRLRMIKSKREQEMVRKATKLAGLGLMEAMKSTRPGVFEYQLAAVARFTYLVNGAAYEGYNAIVGGGTNAWMGHYFRNSDALRSGEMVLMDYAPELRYYTSDVTRIWPVSGTHSADQRAMTNFILAYRDAFLRYLRPGVTADEVLVKAREDMRLVLERISFSKDIYRTAAANMLTFRGHLQHPVGLTVHDVGRIWNQPLEEGMIFTVDPMMWIPEESLYVRMEDVVLITADGVENMSGFVPSTPDEIESFMKGDGLVQRAPKLEDR